MTSLLLYNYISISKHFLLNNDNLLLIVAVANMELSAGKHLWDVHCPTCLVTKILEYSGRSDQNQSDRGLWRVVSPQGSRTGSPAVLTVLCRCNEKISMSSLSLMEYTRLPDCLGAAMKGASIDLLWWVFHIYDQQILPTRNIAETSK